MSHELENHRWNFEVIPDNIPTRSGEDATFDHFRVNYYRYIVREFIQNSLDAAKDRTKKTPVEVIISTGNINCGDFPQLIGSLQDRMQACKDQCDENENGSNPYESKLAYLQDHKATMPFLLIADYNTTGMDFDPHNQSGFNAGVRQMGASHKSTGNAAGSHGLGKTVGFVASEINAVYYSTMTGDGSTFGEGVVRLCTHKILGKTYFADAFYDSMGGHRPDSANDIPVDFRRTEQGTNVFILGITPTPNDVLVMKQEILRSFWMALHNKHLTAMVDDELFDSDSMNEQMRCYLNDKDYGSYDVKSYYKLVEKCNPRPYYNNCVQNYKDCNTHKLFEANSAKYPHLEHALLYVYVDENIKNHTEDRIVCMRDSEMVVEFYRPKTRKGYYGVLICDGNGSGYLRKMENVTHDKWDKAQLKEYREEVKEYANNVLKEIAGFIKTSIDSIFPESEETEYKIPVLSKYLVAAGNRSLSQNGSATLETQDSHNNPQAAISTVSDGYTSRRVQAKKVGRVVIRKKGGVKKKKNKTPIEGGMSTISQPVEAPVTTPVTPSTPTTPPVNTTTPPEQDPNKVPATPKNPTPGETGHEAKGEGKHAPTKSGKHAEDIIAEFRVIPQPSDVGLVHRIIINSDAVYRSCSMAITIAGEDADTTLSFEPVNKNYRVTGKNMNILSDFDLVQGKNYIDIKFEDNDYHSLNIKAYEN